MKSSKASLFFLLVLSIIMLFFIIHNLIVFAPGHLERWTSRIAYPLICLQKRVSDRVNNFLQWKMKHKGLLQEVDQLRSERDDVRAQLIEAEQQLAFANDIEEVVTFKKRYYDVSAVLGQVISRELSTRASYIYLDAGQNKGVVQDMIAVYKNCLVGRVQEVYPKYCKVILVSDPRCKVASFCTHSYATGIHEGTNRNITELNFVSHLQRMQDGDTVASSGSGTIFPRGFVIGRIARQERGDIYYTVEVKPCIDFKQLAYCYLINRDQLK